MPIRIQLLGRPTVLLSDRTRIEHFSTRKAAALLGYLALSPGKPHPREVLAELFWPDTPVGSGRNSLNVALNALRGSLGDALQTDRTYVLLRAESVVTDLAEALAQHQSFDPDTLLLGFYDDFVIQERERLKALVPRNTPTCHRIVPGGAVPLDAPFYLERPAAPSFREALRRHDSTILLKGAHEVGKTSLLARGAQYARECGMRVALTDLATLPEADTASYFLALATALADALGLATDPLSLWSEARSPALNLERFVRRAVLEESRLPTVWALDEVDRLFELPFGTDLFRLFRSWHNRRSLEPEGPWSRLTLVIAYATEAQLFLTDLHQSPFNIGTRLALTDFSPEETAELNRRFGSPLRTVTDLAQLREWVGGQPYLSHLALDTLAQGLSQDALFSQALDPDGLFGGHLRRLKYQDHRAALAALLAGSQVLPPESFFRLRAAGLVTGEHAQSAHFRCRLYQEWFRWVLST